MNYLLDTGNNSIYEKRIILFADLAGFAVVNTAMAQSVTVDVPAGYKVVIVPQSSYGS